MITCITMYVSGVCEGYKPHCPSFNFTFTGVFHIRQGCHDFSSRSKTYQNELSILIIEVKSSINDSTSVFFLSTAAYSLVSEKRKEVL